MQAETRAKNFSIESRPRMWGMRDSFVGFDCFRSDDWVEEGTITYDGCSVDTTAGNPASGNFVVGEQGPYRVVKLNFTTEIEVLMHRVGE